MLELLPGADLVTAGLRDLRRGEVTAEALLVSIGASRLRAAGLDIPEPLRDPGQHGDDAHGRYNALVRRLVSVQRAAECTS
jgi:hypothetical protein